MGQSISRRIVPRLHRAMQKYESQIEEEALNEVAEKQRKAISLTRHSDPSSLIHGFTRGLSPSVHDAGRRKDMAQKKLLRELGGDFQELPDDLVQFLKDAGPVQRTMDKKLTSVNIVKQIEKEGIDEKTFFDREDEKERLRRRHQNRWNRRFGGEGEEQREVLRVESKETILLKEEENEELGMKMKVDDITQFLTDVQNKGNNIFDDKTDEEKVMLQNIMKYIALPIIMKDEDSLVGAWNHNVSNLKEMGLKLVDEAEKEKRQKLASSTFKEVRKM